MFMEKFEIRQKFEKACELIRPYLQKDDGDIEFVNWEEDTSTLVISFLGNCKDCPLSIMTLRAGIEKIIIREIPIVRRIENQ